ncbi:cell division and transport-associated protein TolA [Rhodothalassium salexigens DSM 2132]|uniref:Cell division and transport-associated protein TolA n=1 Tax=Rhodothalassium salexigens DSM 2132 TaxID=1188247 RepID=A0A4R2PPR6_RHOSA|nr:cell envelope integrity protein TolA [Rhodothalassium salexigens]MBB4210665.1 hypothetical protein [Rhodothalassium salexigens DSM 2132]MBK1637866.1 hypothetical protein [Rhodothalassium salexigens DSM 2132]TCP37779.1 cell division and transport-associated protein TolA [Rhodothalassium salexigens DSM 2132]
MGLGLSVALHVGVLLFAIFGLPRLTPPVPEPPEVIEVEFVEVAEETATKADDGAAQPEPPKPEPDPEPQEPAPDPDPKPELRTAPEDVEPEPAEAAPEVPLPEPKPEPKPEPEPEPKPEPEETVTALAQRVMPQSKPTAPSRFDAGQIAALIDKSVKETPSLNVADLEKAIKAEAKRQGARSRLKAQRNLARIEQLIRQKVQRCWSIPVGVKNIEQMSVKIRLRLRPDGSMMGPPRYVNAGDLNAPGREFYRTFAESARRAVQRCAPYDLPVDLYDTWDDIVFNFDASAMVGG